MSDGSAASTGHHPTPHGHRIGLAALLFGFGAAPTAWIVQLLINYGFSSSVCYPGPVSLTTPPQGWRWITPALFGLDAAAVLAVLAGGIVAWRSFAATRDEKEGDPHHLLEVGEGRSRFIALCGLITAGSFLVIVLFNTLSLILVPLCAR